jgi:hypothetical protein
MNVLWYMVSNLLLFLEKNRILLSILKKWKKILKIGKKL